MNRNVCWFCWLGRVPYQTARDLQEELAQIRALGEIPDTLLLLEHPPTYTFGRRGKAANLLVSQQDLERQGVDLYWVDRGGDVTYHGPGQLVGYPVLNLRRRQGGVTRYLRELEEALILALARFGIGAERVHGFTGVWAGNGKIAAIGVKLNARGITGHGFALNVTTDLSYFAQIVPCGIRDKAVTSMAGILGRPEQLGNVAKEVALAFGEVFALEMIEVEPENILARKECESAENNPGAKVHSAAGSSASPAAQNS